MQQGFAMTTPAPALVAHFSQALAQREQELRAMLSGGTLDQGNGQHEVTDFKDVAAEQSAAAVNDVKAEHLAQELEQVLAARRRLQEHTYGLCLDCGEPIDPRRLEALPATPYCTACQAAHERPASVRR